MSGSLTFSKLGLTKKMSMCSEDQNFNFAVNYWLYETENCRIALVCCQEKVAIETVRIW